jgi:hypothetical protein
LQVGSLAITPPKRKSAVRPEQPRPPPTRLQTWPALNCNLGFVARRARA